MQNIECKISEKAYRKLTLFMEQRNLSLSEAIEYLSIFVPNKDSNTDEFESKQYSIQMAAISIVEFTEEEKEAGYIPTMTYRDFIGECVGIIASDLNELGKLVSEVD